jgi:hypothetical protein
MPVNIHYYDGTMPVRCVPPRPANFFYSIKGTSGGTSGLGYDVI